MKLKLLLGMIMCLFTLNTFAQTTDEENSVDNKKNDKLVVAVK